MIKPEACAECGSPVVVEKGLAEQARAGVRHAVENRVCSNKQCRASSSTSRGVTREGVQPLAKTVTSRRPDPRG